MLKKASKAKAGIFSSSSWLTKGFEDNTTYGDENSDLKLILDSWEFLWDWCSALMTLSCKFSLKIDKELSLSEDDLDLCSSVLQVSGEWVIC